MKKGDCFLVKGKEINEPMTVYYVTDIDENYIWAKSFSVDTTMISALPIEDKYNNDIPPNIIPLPSDSWEWGKKEMLSFLKEINAYLIDNVIKEKTEIITGCHYYNNCDIYTITEIGEERIRYNLIKLDEDFISPYWTGDTSRDNAEMWYPISEEMYSEVVSRYNRLLSRLRKKFWGYK